jgi:hypothetical protein
MNVTTLGIDLAKSIFRVHGVDGRGTERLVGPVPRQHSSGGRNVS